MEAEKQMLEDLKKNPAAVDPDAESLARLKALRGEPAEQPAPTKIPFPVAQVTCVFGAAELIFDQVADVVMLTPAQPLLITQYCLGRAAEAAFVGRCRLTICDGPMQLIR